jgi:DNA-binding MarR family transcriptional regulator
MNRTVSLLEEAGYVSRTPDDDDRRKVTIALTDAGRLVVDETVRRRDAWLEEALAALDDDERKTLAAAAEIMRRVAER